MIHPTHCDDSPDSKPRERFQFGILPLLATMTLVAASLAAIRIANLPLGFRVGLAAYSALMILYLTLRVPYVLRDLLGTSTRWKRIRAERAELEEMVRRHQRAAAQRSHASQQAASADEGDSTSD
jgi:hypothetical protein